MKKPPIVVEFTWSEAANLLVVAQQADTRGWTPAAKGNLRRACEALVAALPLTDPNAFYLVVRGQTVVKTLELAPSTNAVDPQAQPSGTPPPRDETSS